jgi:hypothetical protein
VDYDDIYKEGIDPLNDIAQNTSLSKGFGENPVIDMIDSVARFVTGLIAVIAMLMIVVSGIMYITSGGDEKRTQAAKSALTYAIIGLVVALLAYVIVYSVGRMVGV